MDDLTVLFDAVRNANANHRAVNNDKSLLKVVIATNKLSRRLYAFRNEHIAKMAKAPPKASNELKHEQKQEKPEQKQKMQRRARVESVAFDDFEIIEAPAEETKKEDIVTSKETRAPRRDNIKPKQKPRKKSRK